VKAIRVDRHRLRHVVGEAEFDRPACDSTSNRTAGTGESSTESAFETLAAPVDTATGPPPSVLVAVLTRS
jgi:hypothetical protein